MSPELDVTAVNLDVTAVNSDFFIGIGTPCPAWISSSEPGSIPVGAIVETGTAWGVPIPGSLLFYFCQLIPRVGLLVFLLVSAAIDDENCFKFNWLRN